MCDEEVMSLIAEKLGSDLIVIPSSIHETIILKETENMSVRELNAMVEAVNAEAVNPQERLGNFVYRFDREAQSFLNRRIRIWILKLQWTTVILMRL